MPRWRLWLWVTGTSRHLSWPGSRQVAGVRTREEKQAVAVGNIPAVASIKARVTAGGGTRVDKEAGGNIPAVASVRPDSARVWTREEDEDSWTGSYFSLATGGAAVLGLSLIHI